MIELRDYQQIAVNRGRSILTRYNILYLAFETRTGKTLIALSICQLFDRVLFVTKKKAIDSILSDYQKGGFSYDLTVINYESVHKVAGEFDVIVCDEAHALGQMPKPNNRARNIKKLTKGKPIVYLSATPAPETWSQLYHQFWISDFSPFHQYINFYKWAYRYVTIKKKYLYNREMNDYTDANRYLIWDHIKHLFLRKTQADAGFTVKVNEQILTVPMPENVKTMIASIISHKIYEDDDLCIVADTAVKVMQKVHQLSSGTVIDDYKYNIVSEYKAEYLKKWSQNRKLAIFYKFKSELDLLKKYFPNWTDNAFVFQSSDSTFLGQFQSAREGIRLDTADAIVFFNLDFSYLSYEQARNRIASYEREDQAVLYWLFSDYGIEKKIYSKLLRKQDYQLIDFKKDVTQHKF